MKTYSILFLVTSVFLALSPSAVADDAVIFVADESDLKAFDQLLEQQKKNESQPVLPNGKAPFGNAVREEARKLRESGKEGNSMGAWVREQRRNQNSAANPNAQGRSGEVRGMVSDKQSVQGQGKSNEKKGKGHK